MRIITLDEERTRPEERCGNCRLCEAICVLVHEGLANPQRSRIRISSHYDDERRLVFDQTVCHQCAEEEIPACADVCPSEAIVRDPQDGLWKVQFEACIGCEACVDACPHGAIFVDPVALVALKCDLCGGDPQCVAICPAGVLALDEG